MKKANPALVFYKVFLIIVLLLIAFRIPLLPPTYSFGTFKYLRLLIIIIILIESVDLFRILFIKGNWKKFTNLGLIILSLFITLMILEMVFMFVPKSHGVGFTLGERIWFDKYWKPINSFGFRDEEPDLSKPVLLFVGDSFTAGHGIEKAEQRYSNIVRKEILDKGLNYSVINLGLVGLDTRGEYKEMTNFIEKNHLLPNKIILQYYGNDIDKVAAENGLVFKGYESYSDLPGYLVNPIKGSYLANFVYWTLPRQETSSYSKYLENAYKNQKVMSDHENDLKRFIDYSRENSIELIVVIFPFLQDLNASNEIYVNEILKYLEENNIKTINVSPLVENMKVSDRVVNSNDAHASKEVNILVAKEILNTIKF